MDVSVVAIKALTGKKFPAAGSYTVEKEVSKIRLRKN